MVGMLSVGTLLLRLLTLEIWLKDKGAFFVSMNKQVQVQV
jgi:hypothetical protein